MDAEQTNLINLLPEVRERLINIEIKVNALMSEKTSCGPIGHPDQFFGGRTYAQHGDDLIALCLFHSIGIANPSYMDVGAHHPENISNTALLYSRGSRGINIEPNPNLFQNFVKMRPDDINLNVGVSDSRDILKFYMIDDYSGRNSFDKGVVDRFCLDYPDFSIHSILDIEVLTINEIIEKHSTGVFPDFLSIDVEGYDLRIVRSLDLSRSRPKVVCVEVENSKGNGNSSDISDLLASMGYFCVIKAVSNLIFMDLRYRAAIGVSS